MQPYKSASGLLWDPQPACFLTDYVAVGVCLYATLHIADVNRDKQEQTGGIRHAKYWRWYLWYFPQMLLASAAAIAVHYLAFEAMIQFAPDAAAKTDRLIENESSKDPVAVVFRVALHRSTLDAVILFCWHIVLTCSISSNLTLFGLFATEYLHGLQKKREAREMVYSRLMVVACAYYAVVLFLANVYTGKCFIALGWLPVVLFGLVINTRINMPPTRVSRLWDGTASPVERRAWNELAIVACTLCALVVMALDISLSSEYFDENALAHAILVLMMVFVLFNFELDQQCDQQEEDRYSSLKWYGSMDSSDSGKEFIV